MKRMRLGQSFWVCLIGLTMFLSAGLALPDTGGAGTSPYECNAAIGKWKWFTGGEVNIQPDGHLNGDPKSTWTCKDPASRTIEMSWNNGQYIDTLALSGDGLRLEGKNQYGHRVWGEKIQAAAPTLPIASPACGNAVGDWKWFTGGVVKIQPDGHLNGDPKSTWTCQDPASRTIEMSWNNGQYIDTLALSGDGLRLEGKNQYGDRVWGEKIQAAAPTPPTAALPCGKAVGDWEWFTGPTHRLGADGLLDGNPKVTWTCQDPDRGTIVVNWENVYIDTLTLSPDGQRLDGKNQHGHTVWARKIKGPDQAGHGCPDIIGQWNWFTGNTISLTADGLVNASPKTKWHCENPAERIYVINWDNVYIDTLQLSADGKRLEGRNQRGDRVWGTRK